MHNLDLDFHRRPRPTPLGWLLLLAGLGAVTALFAMHRHWEEEASGLQASVQLIEARLPRPGQAAGGADDQGLAAARQALARARLPWGGLFSALESADNPDVALLAITPDSPRGKVKIHGEARNLASMLAYHRRLEEAGSLDHVTLLDHEMAEAPGDAAVRFHISAAWGERHAHP